MNEALVGHLKSKLPLLLYGLPTVLAVVVYATAAPTNYGLVEKSNKAAPAVSDLQFTDYDWVFHPTSRSTELQQDEAFKKHEGKVVNWTGIVDDVNEKRVLIRHRISTQTHDVRLEVDKGERAALGTLSIGDKVTYCGVIDERAGDFLPHVLVNGKIVSSRSMSGTDAQAFLAKEEADMARKHGR